MLTNDDKTLVKRLRWSASGKVGAEQARLERNAADRIEAQAAEIERLRMQLKAAALWTAEPGTTVAEIRAAFGETK